MLSEFVSLIVHGTTLEKDDYEGFEVKFATSSGLEDVRMSSPWQRTPTVGWRDHRSCKREPFGD